MQPDQIHPFDLKRLLIGQGPGLFLLEVALRAVVTYLILLVAARAMGKRVAGQMSVLELTIIVTLGAAIGVPLETPERGMLAALVVLAIAVGYQRLIGLATFKSRGAVGVLEGSPETLVRDGAIELDTLKHAGLSRERLFALLRDREVVQLGQVKRAYLEAGGALSIYVEQHPRVGLCVLPGTDRDDYEAQFPSNEQRACRSCGNILAQSQAHGACPVCHDQIWGPAVQTRPLCELRDEHPEQRAAR